MSLLKKRKPDNSSVDRYSIESSKQLKTAYGSYFGDIIFLMVFQRLFFSEKKLEECVIYILESVKLGVVSHLLELYIAVGACQLTNVQKRQFLVPIFIMLMNTFVHYVIEYRKTEKITCFFSDQEIEISITDSTIEDGNHIFFSEIFRIELVSDGETIKYVATLRTDLRLHHERESGKISFVPSDDTSYPPVILGGGSYGFAVKMMGVDGKLYVVKVFDNKKNAEHEWSALELIRGKNQSLQKGIQLETDRAGDIQHVILSEFQGEIVLSKVRYSIFRLNLQQLILMFLQLADGIKNLHELGILHGDIKPDNIVISDKDETFRLTLIDFGIAGKIGNQTKDPQSYYTSWFRDPSLFLYKFMRGFNTLIGTFVEPVKLSPVMDWWAFFITFLHVVSDKSNDFLGLRSRKEEEVRQGIIRTSIVAQLMETLRPLLGRENRDISFVREIYFVFLNKTGPDEFNKILNDFGIQITGRELYDDYLSTFNSIRDNHPMIGHVKNVFKHIKSENQEIDISEPINKLMDLFVEILRDGTDLSLLGCLTMDHVQNWLDRLKGSVRELIALNTKIFIY